MSNKTMGVISVCGGGEKKSLPKGTKKGGGLYVRPPHEVNATIIGQKTRGAEVDSRPSFISNTFITMRLHAW
jgi:hypothetical protein